MAINWSIRIEGDKTNVSDAIRSEVIRKMLSACAQSGQTTALSVNDTWASGGTPSCNIKVAAGTVDWHVQVEMDTAVVTTDLVRLELIQKMLAIAKETGLTTTTTLEAWVTGGTADALVTLT